LLRIWPGCSTVPKYGAVENIVEEIAQVFIFHLSFHANLLIVNNQSMRDPNLLSYLEFHSEPPINKFTEAYEGDLWLQFEELASSSVGYEHT
jgi:hypothetical protein